MKFFTPQLYQQFNSENDEVADRANDQWEEALRNYKMHLGELRDRLPSQVIKLSELDLHDAEILAQSEELQSSFLYPELPFHSPIPLPFWSAVAVLAVNKNGEGLSLIYCLWDQVREQAAPEDWPFSKLRTHWLQEELDWMQERPFPPQNITQRWKGSGNPHYLRGHSSFRPAFCGE